MTEVQVQKVIEQAIASASSFGGSIWIASLIVIGGGVLAVLHFWFILVPQSKSQQENDKKISEAVVLMSSMLADTHMKVASSAETTRTVSTVLSIVAEQMSHVHDMTKRIVNAKSAMMRAAEKVAVHAGVDIAGEIGEMRGALTENYGDMHGGRYETGIIQR